MADIKTLMSKPINWLILATLATMLVAGLFWQNLLFVSAVLSSETRPALLRDAEWGTPVSAFREQFRPGVSEAELLNWLADNEFKLNGKDSASLLIQALPCNETVEVSWTTSKGIIGESSAVVSEAGCL